MAGCQVVNRSAAEAARPSNFQSVEGRVLMAYRRRGRDPEAIDSWTQWNYVLSRCGRHVLPVNIRLTGGRSVGRSAAGVVVLHSSTSMQLRYFACGICSRSSRSGERHPDHHTLPLYTINGDTDWASLRHVEPCSCQYAGTMVPGRPSTRPRRRIEHSPPPRAHDVLTCCLQVHRRVVGVVERVSNLDAHSSLPVGHRQHVIIAASVIYVVKDSRMDSRRA